jgi:nucleotide-binding universal stress UspA family protein
MKPISSEKLPSFPEHILVPVDFSASCLHGLTAALELAWRFKAELTIIHVLERIPPGAYLSASSDSEVQRNSMTYAEKQLAEFVAEHVPGEMSVRKIVCQGKPFDQVVAKAAELNCDLIVVSTHGHTGLTHVLIGSNAERIVQHAPCPVLVMRGNPGLSNLPSASATAFRWILLATDLSEESSKACPLASAIARAYGAPIKLVHVKPAISTFLAEHHEASERARVADQLDQFRVDHCGDDVDVEITTELLEGCAFREISSRAVSDDPGLIVITTHGLIGWKHALLGSTAERVVRHAPCPVLVVR